MFYKDDGTKVELSDSSRGAFIVGDLMAKEGITYRKIVKPVKVEILTEPRVIPATAAALYLSDGTAPDREVPAGTILVDGVSVIEQEDLDEDYIPYRNESGEIVEGMFIPIIKIRVIRNPFGKPVCKVNPNNWIIEEGNSDCFIMADELSYRYGFSIITEEELSKSYIPFNDEKTYTI